MLTSSYNSDEFFLVKSNILNFNALNIYIYI